MTYPTLFTFDIFGTVLDWQRGLRKDLEEIGVLLSPGDFDAIIDRQAELEADGYRPYAEIVAQSLVETVNIARKDADRIGQAAGDWPLFADSSSAIARLMTVAPCVAMTNSDRSHRPGIEHSLGFAMTDWLCAEDTRVYKPAVDFWNLVAARRAVEPGPHWWHVSAYADYDLRVAASLGLTTVFVSRPHERPGNADIRVTSLLELREHVAQSPV